MKNYVVPRVPGRAGPALRSHRRHAGEHTVYTAGSRNSGRKNVFIANFNGVSVRPSPPPLSSSAFAARCRRGPSSTGAPSFRGANHVSHLRQSHYRAPGVGGLLRYVIAAAA